MIIISQIKDELFGELFCIGNDENTPVAWAKKETNPIESQNYIWILLDLYCYNKDFIYRSFYERKIRDIRSKVYNSFCQYMKEKESILDAISNTSYEFADELDIKNVAKEDIVISEIRIFSDKYSIVFSTHDSEQLVYEKNIETFAEFIGLERESDIVEMCYR